MEKCLRDRDCKRNVHDDALVGGSARIPIVQRMIQEFFNGKEQRFTELVVLTFDTHGDRFANELGKAELLTGEMWKNKPPFRLALASF